LLQFRFYCLLPFITVPIVFVLKLSMYRSESAWSTSLLLIYKKASFCSTCSGSSLLNTKCKLSLFNPKLTTTLLGLFCSVQAQNEGMSLGLSLSQEWSISREATSCLYSQEISYSFWTYSFTYHCSQSEPHASCVTQLLFLYDTTFSLVSHLCMGVTLLSHIVSEFNCNEIGYWALPVAAWSKACVCGCLVAGIAGSSPAGDMLVCR